MTSRDRHVLKVIGGQSNFYLHEVRPVRSEDSQKLFNLHAFHEKEAPKNFKALASNVSKACGELPLALKVVGSSLCDKRSKEDLECIWPEVVDALKGDLNVMNALRWSYECFSKQEKLMFVDIACVFCGWKKQEAMEIWKSCKKCSSCCGFGTPHIFLRQLIDKSLVVIDEGDGYDLLAMHGHLQDLGQGIGMDDGSHLWEGKAANVVQNNNSGSNKVRALNLANCGKYKFEFKNFSKMTDLHFLILDGCDVSHDLASISKELRCLQWRHMPLMCLPPMSNLSNLISLDFSNSTMVATWAESDPALEACPNLLKLDLSGCTSITTLPDSIGYLSRLQALDLLECENLQKLPSSIGQLVGLEKLLLQSCGSLEALPDTITALTGLQRLDMTWCSSISKLPATIELLTGLTYLYIDLATEWQAVAIGQLNALKKLLVTKCTDEAISALDSLGSLRNLDQLLSCGFYESPSMTKFPETIGLLTNLDLLDLYDCEKLRELPNSIAQLKMLKTLLLRKCRSLDTLPDSLGALTSLRCLWIVQCTSMTKLPMSIGHLSSLWEFRIEGCGALKSLPDTLRQLNALGCLEILDCGSLEGLGLLRVLQGLRMWGCTSVTELPGSCLRVVDRIFIDSTWNVYDDCPEYMPFRGNWKEVGVVEADDCGFLRFVQEDTPSGRLILQRDYKLPCCKSTTV